MCGYLSGTLQTQSTGLNLQLPSSSLILATPTLKQNLATYTSCLSTPNPA